MQSILLGCERRLELCDYLFCSFRTVGKKQIKHSNLRSLADKRACRLGFARLSAPQSPLGAWRRSRIKSLPPRQKERYGKSKKDFPYLWRGRRDLNSRAGNPTYTLSRGASSPLEYFRIAGSGFQQPAE